MTSMPATDATSQTTANGHGLSSALGSPFVDRLNDAQKAWDAFSGSREEAERITRELTDLRPRGYIAMHGDGSCRVMNGEGCMTPFRAIPESEAVQLALTHRIQTSIRFRLSDRVWFAI